MPYMGITLATMFTMLRLANEAKMRQVICGGKCPTWACRSALIRVRKEGSGRQVETKGQWELQERETREMVPAWA